MKAISEMYPVLPNPRKKFAKGYYYIQNKILAPAIIINRIGAKISNSSIVRTRVYCIQGKFRPRFIFVHFALRLKGEFKTGLIESYIKDCVK